MQTKMSAFIPKQLHSPFSPHLVFLTGIFLFFLLFPHTAEAACAEPNPGGNYTVSSSCVFSGAVNGVDSGGITINEDTTLTIGTNQTVVWGPGQSITINGAIVINSTGQLKQTRIWMIDSDSDGYPTNTTMVAQDSSPGAGYRNRADLTSFTSIDYDDSSNTVYPGTTCNGTCSIANANGTCTAVAAGENSLAACTRCDGVSLSPVNIATLDDSEGSNTCAGTCAAYCSSGSCINTNTGAGTCTVSTNARVSSGGDGSCTANTCVSDQAANGEACTADNDCVSGNCYVDADNDRYAPSSGTKTCRASTQLSGTDCNDGDSSRWRNRYLDSDRDTYGVGPSLVCVGNHSGYADNNDDCYDSNADAKPGQTTYFATDRGDGSFDYNCVGGEQKQTSWDCVTTMDWSGCAANKPSGTTGYVTSVPACGDSATYRACDLWQSPACTTGFISASAIGEATCGRGCPTGFNADSWTQGDFTQQIKCR